MNISNGNCSIEYCCFVHICQQIIFKVAAMCTLVGQVA